jgi:hypothetical protein
MSDLSLWWWLPIWLALFLVGLWLRNSAPVRRLRSAQYPTEAVAEINERVLREVMRICTPVFLGFAVSRAFGWVEITKVSQALVITGLIAYIIFWLWMQRVFFSFVQIQLGSFDLLKQFYTFFSPSLDCLSYISDGMCLQWAVLCSRWFWQCFVTILLPKSSFSSCGGAEEKVDRGRR